MNEQMIRKNNMRIFPMYKMFSWDLLFHYAIIFLFLTQVKKLSPAQVLLADSCYGIFRVFSQIPCVNIVDSIGKQKSLLLGNIFVSISILLIIIGNDFSILIFSYLIQAIGYSLKALCEPTILSDSIPESSVSSKIYSKIDGKGNSFYYTFDALSSIATGFLYVLNPYIPMILCFVCCLISTILSLCFNEVITNSISTKESPKISFITQCKDILDTLKKIIKSNRLKSLLIFSLCFSGFLSVFGTLRSSILVDIGMPEQYFGIIIAGMQVISSISSAKQHIFHKRLRNRALSWFSLSVVSSFILTGLLVVCNISFNISVISCMMTIILVGIVKGPYYTLIQRYLNSFSNPNVNTKIYAVKSLLENIGRVVVSLFASFLLGIATTSYAFIIIGCIFFVIFIFLLDYMKAKVGLKPGEYSKEDLIFSDEK
ncbi:MAG: MFS transporter [Clostridia bacterium]|nr:MFS transporter [Clostridia bacterium]